MLIILSLFVVTAVESSHIWNTLVTELMLDNNDSLQLVEFTKPILYGCDEGDFKSKKLSREYKIETYNGGEESDHITKGAKSKLNSDCTTSKRDNDIKFISIERDDIYTLLGDLLAFLACGKTVTPMEDIEQRKVMKTHKTKNAGSAESANDDESTQLLNFKGDETNSTTIDISTEVDFTKHIGMFWDKKLNFEESKSNGTEDSSKIILNLSDDEMTTIDDDDDNEENIQYNLSKTIVILNNSSIVQSTVNSQIEAQEVEDDAKNEPVTTNSKQKLEGKTTTDAGRNSSTEVLGVHLVHEGKTTEGVSKGVGSVVLDGKMKTNGSSVGVTTADANGGWFSPIVEDERKKDANLSTTAKTSKKSWLGRMAEMLRLGHKSQTTTAAASTTGKRNMTTVKAEGTTSKKGITTLKDETRQSTLGREQMNNNNNESSNSMTPRFTTPSEVGSQSTKASKNGVLKNLFNNNRTESNWLKNKLSKLLGGKSTTERDEGKTEGKRLNETRNVDKEESYTSEEKKKFDSLSRKIMDIGDVLSFLMSENPQSTSRMESHENGFETGGENAKSKNHDEGTHKDSPRLTINKLQKQSIGERTIDKILKGINS